MLSKDYSELFWGLEIVSSLSILLPLIVLCFVALKLSKVERIFGVLVLLSAVTEAFNFYFVLSGRNNFFVFRIYTAIEICLITLYYYNFYKKFIKTFWVLIILPLFIIISIIDVKINGSQNFDNYATSFEAIAFSIVSLGSFYFLLNHMIFEKITDLSFFWINSGVLLYFGGNLILFIFNNYLFQSKSFSQTALWGIHSCLNILYNSLIAIGFWKIQRR